MIKLISLDIDGTLLDGQGKLSKNNLEAIQTASRRGIHIIINSGRPLVAMVNLLDTIKVFEPVITLTGSLILEKTFDAGWRELKSFPISQSAFAPIFPVVQANQLTTFFLTRNHGYVHHARTNADYIQWFDALMERNDFTGYEILAASPLTDYTNLELPAYKLMFCSDLPEVIHTAYQELASLHLPGLLVESSSDETVEIHDTEAGKKQAIEFLCRRMGIQRDEVMALGDHESDFSLIEWAGVGAIMGNAQTSLKSIAPLVAPSNDRDGVAEMIHAYAL